jgi:hypothetical protein
MNWKITLTLIAGLLIFASPSWAQQNTTAQQDTTAQQTTAGAGETKSEKKAPRFEIIPMGGYVWTVSEGGTYAGRNGDFDFKSGGYWGIAVDINLRPGLQPRLLYRRQNTEVTFKSAGTTETLGDMAVEYWHVGIVKAVKMQNNVMPFTSFSLGGTRYDTDTEDSWKFSVLLGIGAKVYLNDKIGLMVAGQMPFTITDSFLGIGTGGLSLGGTGIAQFDLTAGLVIRL